MPIIKNAISSQKLKWVQRLQSNVSDWKEILLHRLNNYNLLWISDKFYIRNAVIPTISNPFWIEVFEDWSCTLDRYKNHVKTEQDILSQCIWNNDNIKIGNKPVVYKNWIKNGVVFVNDIIDINGTPYPLDALCVKYSLKTNFLQYEGVKRAILSYANSIGISFTHKLNEPIYPFFISCINNCLGHQKIYDMLLDSHLARLPCYDRWEQFLDSKFSDYEWKCFNSIANKCTPSTYLQWFQYKILHRILPTNQFLFKIKYLDTSKCSLCQECDETLYHIFWECSKVKKLWSELRVWFSTVDVQLSFTPTQVLLGIKGKNNYVLNAMILLVKNI